MTTPETHDPGSHPPPLGHALTCPACGSFRTAILSVLKPEPPRRWTAHRPCRACGHDWDEVAQLR